MSSCRLIHRFAIASLLVALPVVAQHPNLERGVAADKMYQFGNIDQINLFNGNLSLTIPIGGDRPVGDRLSYGLTLTYNSKVWESEQVYTGTPDNGNWSYRKKPLTLSNAGFGWILSLGQLLDPYQMFDNSSNVSQQGWRYVSSDGGVHDFFAKLHDTDASTASMYTRDNTYLRLTPTAPANSDCITPAAVNCLVEFPNGAVHEFEPYDSATGRRWRVHQIRDPFGNHVDLTYSATQWQLTDQYGRVTTVNLHSFSDDPNFTDIQQNYQTAVDSVDIPAFHGVNGQVSPTITSRYTFHYAVKWIPRGFCAEVPPAPDSPYARVPVLTSVDLPDGTTYSMDYRSLYDSNTLPFAAGEDTCLAGEITRLTLPTSGQLQWTWQEYDLPARGCEAINETSGVKTRTFHDPIDGTPDATWTYAPATSNEPNTQWTCGPGPTQTFGPLPSEELQNLVTAPTGDQTIHYFSVWPLTTAPPDAGFTRLEYGLPLTHKVAASNGKYLSTKVCAGTCGTANTKRTSHVRYERDYILYTSASTQFDANRRLAGSRTVFEDDAGNAADTDMSQFDGVGHYRTTAQSGTFLGTGSSRITTVAYNTKDSTINNGNDVIATGTYTPDSTGGDFVIPATTAHWILDLFPRKSVSEGTSSLGQHYCFEPSTGFLKGMRTLAAASPGSSDLVTVFKSDANAVSGVADATGGATGNTTINQYFGGDDFVGGTPLTSNATELCALLSNPGVLAYDLRHTFAYGVKRTTEYFSAATTVGFKVLDLDIDGNTGLAYHSRDTAGVETTSQYDTSARLMSSAKPGTATINYTYTNATSSAHAKVKAEQLSSTAGLVRYEVEFDFLGRKSLEKRLMPTTTACPADCLSQRSMKYNGIGWITDVSEWENGTPTHFTHSESFDPFGRPGKVTKPDGKFTTFGYLGVRALTRTIGDATPPIGKTTELYDVHGRLHQVMDPDLDEPALKTTTTYTYDVGNRLSNVSMVDAASPSPHTQPRSFTYDGRGFLLSEQHPETGTVTYGNYDARGHVGTKTVGTSQDIFDLKYEYDSAERLTAVKSRSLPQAQQFSTLKFFTFGLDNDGTNLKRGKLETASRHNSLTFGDLIVTETYGYNDLAGRMTDKSTRLALNGSPGAQVSQGYTYNDLDLVSKIIYPTCGGVGCGEPVFGEILPAYTNGALTGVPPFVNDGNIKYSSNGAVNTITRANGMTDTYATDAMARPTSITFDGFSACTAARIDTQPSSQTIFYGDQVTLAVGASGTPALQYRWFENGSSTPLPGETAATLTRTLYQTTTYQALVFNACGSVKSAVATITVNLHAPAGLVATKNGSIVNVSWNAVSGASHYVVDRLASGSWLINIASPSGPAYSDPTVAANTTYVYRARAVDSNGNASANSNLDLATTMTFSSVTVGMVIPSVHFTELLNGVNAVFAASGSAPVNWPPGTTPVPGGPILASQLTFLRSSMDSALNALSLPTSGYTDPNPASVPVRAVHVTELQGRTQ